MFDVRVVKFIIWIERGRESIKLRQHLGLSKKTTRGLMISMSKETIQESYYLWKSRNIKM